MTNPPTSYDQDNPYAKARGLVRPSVVGPSSYDDDNPYAKARGLVGTPNNQQQGQNQVSIPDQIRERVRFDEDGFGAESGWGIQPQDAWGEHPFMSALNLNMARGAGQDFRELGFMIKNPKQLSGLGIGKEASKISTSFKAVPTAVKSIGAGGVKGAVKGVGNVLGKTYGAVGSVAGPALALHGVITGGMNAYGEAQGGAGTRSEFYGGGTGAKVAGATEGLVSGLTSGGYDAVRGNSWYGWNPFYKKGYERINPNIESNPMAGQELGEWLGDLIFKQNYGPITPKNNL
jgi:hypothetical protein